MTIIAKRDSVYSCRLDFGVFPSVSSLAAFVPPPHITFLVPRAFLLKLSNLKSLADKIMHI